MDMLLSWPVPNDKCDNTTPQANGIRDCSGGDVTNEGGAINK